MNIALLAGGTSAEREISLQTAAAVGEALAQLGHDVTQLDVTNDLPAQLAEVAPDVVFNALHGRGGEDGVIQGLLQTLGYRYTHSGVASSAVAMDKVLTKAALSGQGIDLAADKVVSPEELYAEEPFARPYVLKAPNEGSSVSVIIMTEDVPKPAADVEGPWQEHKRLLAEEYIPGRELSVAVLKGKALGVLELRPKKGFYDYAAKYTDGLTQHFMPAPVSDKITEKAMADAQLAHTMLGCRGVTRSDFRYDDRADRLVFLEINTQPGMTKLSIVPEIAAYAGITFEQLVSDILDDADMHL